MIKRKWILARCVFKVVVWKGVGWIHLAQDRDQWLALMNAAINLYS
jgi:hypothetical protein